MSKIRAKRTSPTRSRAALRALKKMPRRAATTDALARQAKDAARRRSPRERSDAARKAARTRKRIRE